MSHTASGDHVNASDTTNYIWGKMAIRKKASSGEKASISKKREPAVRGKTQKVSLRAVARLGVHGVVAQKKMKKC